MKKILKKIFIITGLFLAFFGNTFANNTDLLNKIKDEKKEINIGNDTNGFIIQIADSLVNIFLTIALVYFFIITIKLIFSENSEEESSNFKKGFIWISIGIIIMLLAKIFVKSIYSTEKLTASSSSLGDIANILLENIVKPLTSLLETGAAFLFVLIGIYAFFKLISSNGDEETAKKGKLMIFHSIIGFIIIKVSGTLISAVYGTCEKKSIGEIFKISCKHTSNIFGVSKIITDIINWINSFVGIGIIIMVIYIGLQIIFSNGDEEKLKSGKRSLIFIIIGVGILVMNYLILTFFLK